jgi:hypothetical protein
MTKKYFKAVTRRDFLRGTAYAGFGTALGLNLKMDSEAKPSKKARVVLVRDKDVYKKDGQLNAGVIQDMLDRAVTTLWGEKEPATVWKLLVKPKETVGIKSNVWNPLPTPTELEEAINRRLIGAGVDSQKILIDDRGARGTLAHCTSLINVRPLRTHHWSGIGGCIKNYIMFVPNPSDYHGDICTPLGAIWNLPIVKGKTRLNILVVLKPLFYGRGPHHYNAKYAWNYNGLLVSEDPVALDAVGVQILEKKRRLFFGEDRPLKPLTKHITAAELKYHLGISALNRIEIIKVGWTKDLLI